MRAQRIVGTCLVVFVLAAGALLVIAGSAASAASRPVGWAAPAASKTLNPIADAYVYSANPTKNYGTVSSLVLGSQTATDASRALFTFDLSILPADAILDSATFRAYMTSSGTLTTLSVGVYRIDAAWTETGVAWAGQPPVTSIGKSNGVGITAQYYGWDVLGLVQEWLDTPATNFGLELRSETEGTVGWRTCASREADLGFRPELVVEYHLPEPPPPEATPDLGDAPDSTNSAGRDMSAYDTVPRAEFPTVFGHVAPHGPRHENRPLLFHLGYEVSAEEEADVGLDADGINNINPLVDLSDSDGADDGLGLPPSIDHCVATTVGYRVRVYDGAPDTAYVNLWFDWNRNGRWGEVFNCGGTTPAPEWAVQNQEIELPAFGWQDYETPVFFPYNLNPNEYMWVRITVAGVETTNADGSGPAEGYQDGETEDYLKEPNPPDLIPTGLEVNQAIQNLANDVPLVEDKPTWVRVHVASTLRDVDDVDALLYGTRAQNALDGSPLSPAFTVTAHPNGGNRGNLGDAFLFYLPASWLSGEVMLRAEINPDHTIVERDNANNSIRQTVDFVEAHPLCVDMVRVHLHPTTASTNDPGFWDIVAMIQRIYPVSEVRLWRGGVITPLFHDRDTNWELPDDFGSVLRRLWWYNAWTDDPDECDATYYYGMCHPDHLAGRWGIGYVDGDEAAGVMDVGVAFDAAYPSWMYPLGAFTAAHELGHNFGREHVLCTGDEDEGGDVDDGWPGDYPPCQIAPDEPDGYYGLLRPIGNAIDDLEVIEPTEAKPLMSYGWPQWIDDYTYRALFHRLEAASAAANRVAAPPASWLQAGDYLYAAGVITPDGGTATFDHFYRLDEAKSSLLAESWTEVLAASGSYSLTLEDGSGQVLYTHPFTPKAPSVGPAAAASPLFFGEIFPYQPATARIALVHNGTELASRQVSPNSPVVEVTLPDGGAYSDALSVAWEATDADAGDDLISMVQYSPDGGTTWLLLASHIPTTSLTLEDTSWLPGSSAARVRVTTSDGVNTGQATSAPFSLARRPPEVYITEPSTGASVVPGSTIILAGIALDPEDGPISDPARLVWTSSLSGTLGTGSELLVTDLPVGAHHITLAATDSDGMTGSAKVILYVGTEPEKVYLPLVWRE
jgi:hypothetical protein